MTLSSLPLHDPSARLTSGRSSTAPLTCTSTSTTLFLQLIDIEQEYMLFSKELHNLLHLNIHSRRYICGKKTYPATSTGTSRIRGERRAATAASKCPKSCLPRCSRTSTQLTSYALYGCLHRTTRSPRHALKPRQS